MIRSLIQQFSHQSGGTPIALAELYGKGQWHPEPSIKPLYLVLQSILDSFSRAYIIVDSLDECTDRSKLLDWIQMISSNETGKLNLLFTSRPEPNIRTRLEATLAVKVCIDYYNNSDIEQYVDNVLRTDDSLSSWDEVARSQIKEALVDGAGGM